MSRCAIYAIVSMYSIRSTEHTFAGYAAQFGARDLSRRVRALSRAGRVETYVVLVFAWDSGPRAIVKMSGVDVDVQWDGLSVLTMVLESCNPSCDAKPFYYASA